MVEPVGGVREDLWVLGLVEPFKEDETNRQFAWFGSLSFLPEVGWVICMVLCGFRNLALHPWQISKLDIGPYSCN